MGLPIYDCAIRSAAPASGGAMIQLVPPVAALGTGRMVRLRQVAISNTTSTGFGVGLGIATAAAVTPATAGTPVRRSNTVGAIDAAPISLVWGTYGTTPTMGNLNARLWVPGNGMVVWIYNEGEELCIPPAATPLPFCVFSTGTSQVSDITLSWEE
jgi:hypothetical protein